MPIARVQAPDGRIARFEVPEGATPEQIEAFAEETFGNGGDTTTTQARQDGANGQEQGGITGVIKDAASWTADAAKGLQSGLEQGLTFGGADELKAAIAAGLVQGAGLIDPDAAPNDFGYEFDKALATIQAQDRRTRDAAPVSSFIGELAGGAALGGAGSSALKGTNLARFAARNPKTAASGIGGISGGLYAVGTGEGSGAERLEQAGVPALLGLGFGAGGAAIAEKAGPFIAKKLGPLSEKASRLFKKNRTTDQASQTLDEMVGAARSSAEQPSSGVSGEAGQVRAINLVIERLKRDYPDNWEQILAAWKNSDAPLADVAQNNMTNLAKGAAQYPRGEAVARRYFDDATAASPERTLKNIGGQKFYETADDIVAAGRKEAAPLYDKAYQDTTKVWTGPLNAEVNQAIRKARAQFPTELRGYEDNSVKVLDYAKRVLDDQIGAAQRGGERNLARSRTQIKDELLEALDKASPSYAQARSVSGDYLSTERAMMDGLDIFKPSTDKELLSKTLKEMTESEKTAYRSGVQKAIREQVERVTDGANPYRSILGTPDKRARLAKVLSPTEFKTLEKTLKAEDRLFRMRNEVVGGSPTTGKAMAAADIAAGGQEALAALATGGAKGAGLSAVSSIVKNAFNGLNDKTAEHVARLIFERDPQKKLLLIDRMSSGSSSLTPTDRNAVKKAYFGYENFLRSRTGGAVDAGLVSNELASDPKDNIPTITIRKRKGE